MIPIPLLLLAACNGAGLTEGEAQSTFQAVNCVTDDVILLARDAVEQGASASLLVADADGGFTIHGSATEGKDWSGLTTVIGSVSDDGDTVGYDLAVTFDQVEIVDGPTLDGELDVGFSVTDFGTAGLNWTITVSMDGDLELSGAITGHAAIHYDLTLAIDGWSVSFQAHGTLDGYDVSGWSYTDSAFSF